MYNWSVDEKAFKKADPKGYELWKLEQKINYGLAGEKLDEKEVRQNWNQLFIDPETKEFLEFLLWPRKQFSPKSK